VILIAFTLDNPNPYNTSTGDNFGISAAVVNYAIVRAYNEDDAGGVSSGKAYMFEIATTTPATGSISLSNFYNSKK
jgi:penicillin-binding protein-related factor A (putative recombinase)